MKVKILNDSSPVGLQDQINEFLRSIGVLEDLQYRTATKGLEDVYGGPEIDYSVLIRYN